MEVIKGPEQTDILFLTEPTSPLIEEGLLLPLDPFIKKYEYDLEGMESFIVKNLRQIGNEAIYFLPTDFNTYALFYNKDLFDQYGLQYPSDYMTWEEVFNLARQFNRESTQEKVYGFIFGDDSDLLKSMEIYAAPMDISMYSGDMKSMTVNTPAWQEVWRVFADIIRDEVIPMLKLDKQSI